MQPKHPIDRAADAMGGAAKLASVLGVSAQAISNWKERGVPLDRCVAIEQATGITRKELRPDDWKDIWPELDTKPRTPESNPRQRAGDKVGAK